MSDTRKVTQLRVLKSEWKKATTLRSSYVALILAFLTMAGIGIAVSWSTADEYGQLRNGRRHHFNPLVDSLSGFLLAQLILGVLGILLVGGEYTTGMIRASLSAVPKRLPMLWGKLVVYVTVTLATMLPATLIAFFMSQRLLSSKHIQTTWNAPMVSRVVIGCALYLTILAAFSIGLATIMRNIAGSIAVFVGVIIVLPAIASVLPETWALRINKFLPSNAGQAIMNVDRDPLFMSPWRGLGTFALYALAIVGIGAILLKRRDA